MARAPNRNEAILDAAQELILKHGLRGTSMEAIAARAGIAKPTLYVYFPDKPAVFEAILDRLVATWRSEFLAALTGDGDVVQRVGAALVAKNKAVWRLLADSPHAEELYEEHDRGGAAHFAALEAQLTDAVERELIAGGVSRARMVAQLLMAASYGIGRKAQSLAELGPALRLITERLVRPELGSRT